MSDPSKGAVARRSLRWDRMRRPRLRLANEDSGGGGAPPGATRGPCEELADTRRKCRVKARPAAGGRRCDGAPVGASLSPEARCRKRQLSTTLRRPALRPLRLWPEGKEGEGVSRAGQRTGRHQHVYARLDRLEEWPFENSMISLNRSFRASGNPRRHRYRSCDSESPLARGRAGGSV